jgi:alpha-L-glutamate ligase-like protein
MAVSQAVLGMNARNFLYVNRYNHPKAKRMADDKLLTKRLLIKNGIPTSALIASFRTRDKIRFFNWEELPSDGFVIKPARGWGGGGILVVKSWNKNYGYSIKDERIEANQIRTHLLDIFDGAYSLQNLPDYAFIEERITPHPFFKRIAPVGLPDVRIIVFNRIPIMATIRIPTKESDYEANLTKGALGLGVDLHTGITTYAYYKHAPANSPSAPEYIPGTKIKVRGIKIPDWDQFLLIATKTQAISGLGYAGVDIVMDADRGPLVLENNSRPGLTFQLVNRASLRTRLERVENLPAVSPGRGIDVAKSLFADPVSEKATTKPKVIGVIEKIIIEGEKYIKAIDAKIDTGAYRTSIDSKLVSELGIPVNGETVEVRSSHGISIRPLVKVVFHLSGKKIVTTASVTKRKHLNFSVIIGRKDLKGFVVDPTKNVPKEIIVQH